MAALKISAERIIRICLPPSLRDSLTPSSPPQNPPASSSRAWYMSGCPSAPCTTRPAKAMTISAGCELIATSFIFIPRTSTMNGTMTTPPPIPKKLDTIPAEMPASVIRTAMNRVELPPPSFILPLNSMYALSASMPPSMTLKRSGSAYAGRSAPTAVPGSAMIPSFIPAST